MFGTVKTCIVSEDTNVRGKTEARLSPQENKRKQKAEMVMTTRGPQWVMRLMASQNWKWGGGGGNNVQGNELLPSHSFKKYIPKQK